MTALRLRTMRRLTSTRSLMRKFSLTLQRPKIMGDNPDSNLPDPSSNSSAAPNAKMRTQTQDKDQQSSASTRENLSGDDHPAKQPDDQQQPTRSTGIGGQQEVKGGKDGLKERSEKSASDSMEK